MSSNENPGSLTMILRRLGAGEDAFNDLANKVIQRLFHVIVPIITRQLNLGMRSVVDVEDLAYHAIASAVRNQQKQQAAGNVAADSQELRELLLAIVTNKTKEIIRNHTAEMRDYRQKAVLDGLEHLLTDPITPELISELDDSLTHYIDKLDDDTLGDPLKKIELKKIALLKLLGFTTAEIATEVGVAERSVERKWHRIRKIWYREIANEDHTT